MQISRIAKGDWGKVKAFFDLTTSEGITIKGFKLVEGVNGLFVGCPSEKDQSGAYKDKVWMDKEIKDELRDMAKDAYENGINQGYTKEEYQEVNQDNPKSDIEGYGSPPLPDDVLPF